MILKLKAPTKIPVEAECISPDVFAGKSAAEIGDLKITYGNKEKRLADLFEISGREGEEEIVVEGDVSNVKRIGVGMKSGRITIKGDIGMHLGSEMDGGEIMVHGDAGDWVGAEMRGGSIRVKGNVGNLIGAAYRGSKSGMKGGIIVVEGNSGHEVGELMRRGTIVTLGEMGTFAGAHMKGGTILCFGRMRERAGAGMNRGTIVAFNPLELLPTFRFDSTYNPTFLRFCLKELRKYDLPIKDEHISGSYDRYSGDITELGKGEILVWRGKRGLS
jgi:formylmethanofuran dehydrogenase subunit C